MTQLNATAPADLHLRGGQGEGWIGRPSDPPACFIGFDLLPDIPHDAVAALAQAQPGQPGPAGDASDARP